MTATPKTTGPCDNCKQPRPLFRYEPDCGLHLGADAFNCPWCSIPQQPLLCTRCWSTRKEQEDNDPRLAAEQKTLEQICASNRRVDERRQQIREECDGIAEATRRAEAGR